MKKSLCILVLAVAEMAMQACGSKPKESNESVVTVPVAAKTEVVPTPAERKAKIAREKAERLEKRRIEHEKLVKAKRSYKDAAGNLVYNKAEVAPAYKGGDKALTQYLHDNLKFPEEAVKKGVEGTVFVDFIIGKNGSVRGVEVTDATSDEVDQSFRNEAIRVITTMPKWIAGRQHGKAVDVKYSLPITFEMI